MSEITADITATEERLLSFDEDGTLGRDDCVSIYSYWPLGKRVVKALQSGALCNAIFVEKGLA